MTNTAQVDKIISEVSGLGDAEKAVLFSRLEGMIADFDTSLPEELPIEAAFGLWKDRDISKESIRRSSWKN